MRTFTLLAALLLLAFQARAQTLQETAEQVPTQDQPEEEDQELLGDEDQDQPEDEDQDVAVSFTEEERITKGAAGETPTHVLLGYLAHWRGLLEETWILGSK